MIKDSWFKPIKQLCDKNNIRLAKIRKNQDLMVNSKKYEKKKQYHFAPDGHGSNHVVYE